MNCLISGAIPAAGLFQTTNSFINVAGAEVYAEPRGKSLQVSGIYIRDRATFLHPSLQVGDVSELFLGGIHSQRGKRRQKAIAPIANSTNYLLKALAQAIPRFPILLPSL
jgi:hypothetical protein